MESTTRAGWAGLFTGFVLLGLAAPAHADSAAFAGRFVRLDRDWGEVEVGLTEGAPARLMVTGPAGAYWPTAGIGSGSAVKAAYFTDLAHDVRIGVSYAPAAQTAGGLGDARHLIEGAIRHTTSIGAARLDFMVGGVRAQTRNPLFATPLRSLMAGGEMVWRSLRLGAALRDQKAEPGLRRSWSAGVAYRGDTWNVRTQVARTMTAGESTSGGWSTRVGYRLIPGIAVTAALSRSAATEDGETTMRLGTRIAF